MNIIITANNFFPDPGSGGSGRVINEVGKRLVKRGHNVDVITIRRGNVDLHSVHKGINVWRYKAGLLQIPYALKRVKEIYGEIIRNQSVDVLNYHGPFTSFLVDRVADNAIPCVFTFHSPWAKGYKIKMEQQSKIPFQFLRERLIQLNAFLRRTLEKKVVNHSDHIIVLSEYMKGELERICTPKCGVTIIPGGVDLEKFKPNTGPPPPNMQTDGINFLTVRRLSPRMGLDMLLKAFAKVSEFLPGATLYIAGDGPLRKELKEQTSRLGIDDRVVFLGFVPEEDLPSYYAHSDIFLLPTISLEGFGLVTLEAMASGTPVIGTSIGGTKEVLGNFRQDALVNEINAGAFADKMIEYASKSKKELSKLGKECRSYAHKYSWEEVTNHVESLFKGLLK